MSATNTRIIPQDAVVGNGDRRAPGRIVGVVTKVHHLSYGETVTYRDVGEQNITGRHFPPVRVGDLVTVRYRWPEEPEIRVVKALNTPNGKAAA